MIAGCAAPQLDTARHPASAARPTAKSASRPARWPRSTRTTSRRRSTSPSARSPRRPSDAGFRALLGNAYFAGGRFRSAEAAYKDSLTIYRQPAAGRPEAGAGRDRAGQERPRRVAFLDAGRVGPRPVRLRPRAGARRPAGRAIAVLEAAARASRAPTPASARTSRSPMRLSGDWTNARTVAAQDVPADQLDARIQQWMQLAKPAQAVGPGRGAGRRHAGRGRSRPAGPARAAPSRHAARQAAAGAQPVAAAPAARRRSRTPAPSRPLPQSRRPRRRLRSPCADPHRRRRRRRLRADASRRLPRSRACRRGQGRCSPRCMPHSARAGSPHAESRRPPPLAAAASRRGNSRGGRPARRLWLARARARRLERQPPSKYRRAQGLSADERALRRAQGHLLPPVGQGFASEREARSLCSSLQQPGGSCFVRDVAGDAPVQIASR